MGREGEGYEHLLVIGSLLALVWLAGHFGWLLKALPPASTDLRAACPPKPSPRVSLLATSSPQQAQAPASMPVSTSGPGGASRSKAKTAGRRTISGKVVQTSDYCGGANPSEEILEFLRKEKPFPNKEVFVRAGNVNAIKQTILKFTTDAEGNFKISLPPGDYCFIDDSKKDALRVPDFTKENQNLAPSQQYHLTSEECLKQWWETCDKTLKVEKKDLKGVVIKYHRACNPPCVVGGPKPM